jgi:hypothetical protein
MCTRMIFAAVLSPTIKIFHRHLGPNLYIFAVKVSPWFHRDFMTYHCHFTAKKHQPSWFRAKSRCAYIPVNPPPFCGSLPRKSLISCAGDINLPHTPFPPAWSPPNKKIRYNKILTYILRSIFLEIPHLELPCWWKTPRYTNGKGV